MSVYNYQGYLRPYIPDIINMAALGMPSTAIAETLGAKGARSRYNYPPSNSLIRFILRKQLPPSAGVDRIEKYRAKIAELQRQIDELENRIDVVIAYTKSRRSVVNFVSSKR
jgi:hypothetical protein